MERTVEHDDIYAQISDYIRDEINSTDLIDRENEAIRKMSCLKTCEFLDLLVDVKDEILRRSRGIKIDVCDSMFSSKRNLCRRKISKLDERKFRNILVDVFIVYKHRFPTVLSEESLKIQGLISELASLVISMRSDSFFEQSVLKSVLAEDSLRGKCLVYNKYVKRIFEKYNVDLSVLNVMDECFSKMSDSSLIIDVVLDPILFIKQVSGFFDKCDDLKVLFEFYVKNIERIVSDSSYSKEVQNKLVGQQISCIVQLLYSNKEADVSFDSESIEPEVNTIIMNLEAVKTAMQKKDARDEYFAIGASVLGVICVLNKKLRSVGHVGKDIFDKLKHEQSCLEKCISDQTAENVPNVIFNLAQLVKGVLCLMPLHPTKDIDRNKQ